ncbi:hypothetical protein [Haloarchaeobius iranensis]|uniref:Uncharacterized protein n=1 Tax=Haloarchaeobius iranensis TaxID=996166 RepID=A0A1G9VNG6_9EURY|nr:hypothetical protein [Haloarchaeobius iranensis]SDM73650.1 hypothetical protein SAMN05192554_106204 [Haloarchaeobius iranensis]
MEPRQCYVVGLGLCLVGGLATVVSLVLAGAFGVGAIALAATGTFVLALDNVPDREPFDIEPTLAHRVATWGGAVFTLVAGIVMLGIGVLSAVTFA